MADMIMRTIRRREAVNVEALPGELHPLLRRLYANRGVASAAELDLNLNQLIPISQLGGVPQAIDLLCTHFQRRSRVVVVGDFDADGATSTALVVRQLRRLGFAEVEFLVPNRFRFGYGLTPEIVRLAPSAIPPSSSPSTTACRATRGSRRRARWASRR
jgi:single-stranded-DNA-specific exonuclease